MTLFKCPRCQRVMSRDSLNSDFVHECNSGNPTLDNEDILNLTSNNWKMQGIANTASTKARIMGEQNETRTRRGHDSSTYRTRKHQQYINDLKPNIRSE